MNQQDELEKLIRKIDETTDGLGEWHDATEYLEWARKEVQRILNASRPRVVETAEELEALPHRVIVESSAGSIAARFDDEHGVIFGDDRPFPWMRLALPVTVLRMPKETP